MAITDGHEYLVRSTSTPTFGRAIVSARDQHVVVDGPVHNGCPGEAMGPAELFLGGVVACGIELVESLARERGIDLPGVDVQIGATIDRSHAVRSDVTVFSSAALQFTFSGVGDEDAAELVEAFKGR